MLHLYISHAPADKKALNTLLLWLKPLEDKYSLHIWYDHPLPQPKPLPIIWQLLFFWYQPPQQKTPYHPDMLRQVQEGHLYLFLTSHNALSTPHINQIEIPAAADRYIEHGENFVRIYPVLLTPSKWDKFSRLSGFKVLGPAGSLAKADPPEDGYKALVEALEPVIQTLRKNWMEHYYRMGLPPESFNKPSPLELPEPEPTPLPGWFGWLLMLAIIFSVTSWFTTYCAPKMYYKYKPERTPLETRPEPYIRDRSVAPVPDTSTIPPQEETDQIQSDQ